MSTCITSGDVIRKGYEISIEQPAESRTALTISSNLIYSSAFSLHNCFNSMPLTQILSLCSADPTLLPHHPAYFASAYSSITLLLRLLLYFCLSYTTTAFAPVRGVCLTRGPPVSIMGVVDRTRAPLTLLPRLKYHYTPF